MADRGACGEVFFLHKCSIKNNVAFTLLMIKRLSMPIVSVILPNYNHASFLKERIDSILNQTYQDFELILLDDCSTDNSRDILSKYEQHPKVSALLLNEKNTGNTFLQWDRGIRMAKGKYVWIAESDDCADVHFLECTVRAMEQNRNAVMCLTGSISIDEHGNQMKHKFYDRWKETGEVKCFDGHEYVKHNLMYRNYVYNASMVLFRREVYVKLDKSFQRYRCAGDWQFWAEVAWQGDVLEVRSRLNRFRQHTNKVSSRAKISGEGVADAINVVHYILTHSHVSRYKRWIIQGECYRRVRRLQVPPDTRRALFAQGQELMSFSVAHDYLGRVNRLLAFVLPWLPTYRSDLLK